LNQTELRRNDRQARWRSFTVPRMDCKKESAIMLPATSYKRMPLLTLQAAGRAFTVCLLAIFPKVLYSFTYEI